ncbi:MAG: adenylyl-sulfate kinase [Chthoniobacterales bacterium]|nr:adenylyl-sulfate kinase [Chthoniobacterales bacterium]
MNPSPLRIITIGHVDHGKSTLLGRLLFNTDALSQEKLTALASASQAEGKEMEFAFLLDAFAEEQRQNITIETTQIPFRTSQRDYLLIDAPGHEEFLKNMVTGATSAHAALLLIDAAEGIKQQTHRHLQLLALLGIKQIAVLINKMDLVHYDVVTFQKIATATEQLFGDFHLPKPLFIPISARLGENITTASLLMPWYQGPTLLEAMDRFHAPPSLHESPLRLIVQDVYHFEKRRLIVGRVESGTLRVGQEVLFSPSGKKSSLRSLEEWNTPIAPTTALPGASVAITLEEPLFIERGHVGSDPHSLPLQGDEINAQIFWLDPQPLLLNQSITLKLGTQSVQASLIAIKHIHDAMTLQPPAREYVEVAQHEVATVSLHLHQSIVYDHHDQIEATGRFAVEVENRFRGGGIILKNEKRSSHSNLTWSSSYISREARRKQFGHPGAILYFTGLSGAGKSTLAKSLEKYLHERNIATFILDGDNLRYGLCSDLSFSKEDRTENMRRVGEVAKLFAEAGLIVIVALIAPFRADRELLRTSCLREKIPFAEIFIDASLSTCKERDPHGLYAKAQAGTITHFTGITSPYESPDTPDLHLITDQHSLEETIQELEQFVLEKFSFPSQT